MTRAVKSLLTYLLMPFAYIAGLIVGLALTLKQLAKAFPPPPLVRVYYVARQKDGTYAYEGQETGIGRAISSTSDIAHAKKFGSPDGVVAWAGGHADHMEVVKLTVTYEIGETVHKMTAAEYWE